MSNLPSLQSIDFGSGCFGGYYEHNKRNWIGGAPSFSLIGIAGLMSWRIDLPQLQSVKLGNKAFQSATSFAMSNLTSLQSIEIGDDGFSGYAMYYYSIIYAGSFSLICLSEWIKWWIALPQLQSVKLGNKAFLLATTFELSNLPSLQSIDIGDDGFIGDYNNYKREWIGGASSFSLTGMHEWRKWIVDLPQLHSVKIGGRSFGIVKSFAMSNLTSLQSIEFGQECFGGNFNGNKGEPSFSLNGMNEWMKLRIDLPQLQSVVFDKNAFQYAKSFEMSNLPSLQSVVFGSNAFQSIYSFKMSNLNSLQSLKLDDTQMQYSKSFAMSNLTSLVSIEFGKWCFGGYNGYGTGGAASLFSLIGITE